MAKFKPQPVDDPDPFENPMLNPMAVPTRPMRMRYRIFRGGLFTSWEALCDDVAAFCTSLGRARVASISHSEDKSDAVVTVWYWE